MAKKSLIIAAVAVLVVIAFIAILVIPTMVKDTAPKTTTQEKHVAQWTTFFWFDQDNNLAEYHQMECNLHYMQMVENSTDVNMLCVNDDPGAGNTVLMKVTKGYLEMKNLSDIDPTLTESELNMGDPDQLLLFLKWGMENYPAYRYNIHLANHGGGWRGMCWDDTSSDHLTIQEIDYVCATFKNWTGKNVEILSTEGCLVGMLEFAYEIRNTCDYFVGGSTYGWGAESVPENDEWYPGNWQYDACWGELTSNPNMSAEDFALTMTETFMPYGPWRAPPFIPKQSFSDVMATFNLSKIDALAKAVDVLANELLGKVQGLGQTVNQALLINTVLGQSETPDELNTESFSAQMDWIGVSSYTNFDLYDFAYMLTKNSAGSLKSSNAQKVMDLVTDCIMTFRFVTDPGGHPDAHGISIYLPYRNTEYNSDYADIQFSKDTQWDDFINAVRWV